MSGPWGSRFRTLGPNSPLLSEIRFEAIDVLFVSPFYVKTGDTTFILGDGSNLNARFDWVVRAARTKNPNIKIIAEQFYRDGDRQDHEDFRALGGDQTKIHQYAESVASFIGDHYNKTLPALTSGSGSGTVSARIDGFDVDVESSTFSENLPQVMTAVRAALASLQSRLSAGGAAAPRFSVSITPAWTKYLDSSIASSCDYINMQNYSGGAGTRAEQYLAAVNGLRNDQLAWGFCTEQPWRNDEIIRAFSRVKEKVLEATAGHVTGVYTWRINSDNYAYENMFQVWMHNLVHEATLPDSPDESVVGKYWDNGGRQTREGPVIPRQELR